MYLSPNFTLWELTRSRTAERLGIDNRPSPMVITNLTLLCTNVLQPIRDYYNLPVTVNSGFRCKKLNRRIGGSTRSQHVKGQAADIEIKGVDNYDLALYIRDNLDFDQLIFEFYQPGDPNSGWIHVSYSSPESNRHQPLTSVKVKVGSRMKTRYLPGIVL